MVKTFYPHAAGGGAAGALFDYNSGEEQEYILDGNGNPTFQPLPAGINPYSFDLVNQTAIVNGAAMLLSAQQIFPSEDDVWAEPNGDQWANNMAFAGCPCELQSTLEGSVTQSLAFPLRATENEISAQETAGAPANCPICNLPPPEPPSCVDLAGKQSEFLILVGDSGLNNPNGAHHDVGDLFNLAAQTRANYLQAQGHHVVACRVSSVQDFDQELTQNGVIDGGVIYFGHSGALHISSGYASAIFVGEEGGTNTNITGQNVKLLSNAQTANAGKSILGTSAAIELDGCNAAFEFYDVYAGYSTSIAALIATQVNRGVYAYNVGTYFSQHDAAHDKYFDGTGRQMPDSLPMYEVPVGPPGHKPNFVVNNP